MPCTALNPKPYTALNPKPYILYCIPLHPKTLDAKP